MDASRDEAQPRPGGGHDDGHGAPIRHLLLKVGGAAALRPYIPIPLIGQEKTLRQVRSS